MVNQEINILRKKIKDLEAQRVMLKLLIKEYADKSEFLRNMTWIPNVVPGTDDYILINGKVFQLLQIKKH